MLNFESAKDGPKDSHRAMFQLLEFQTVEQFKLHGFKLNESRGASEY